MSKQSRKVDEMIPNVVYDSYNDVVWNMDDFFERFYDYFEGNPAKLAEELVSAVHVITKINVDEIFARPALVVIYDLLTIREVVLGMHPDDQDV